MKYYCDTVVLFLNSMLTIENKGEHRSNIGTAHLLTPWSLDQKVVVTWDLVPCPGWKCSNNFLDVRDTL